jgi:glyoxylase-like metal-dependent hydrolase (beta-lactamase superfamily II)
MTIKILNCGSMHPFFPAIHGGITCLLVDTIRGPVLVDTGFGREDYLHPNLKTRLFTFLQGCPCDLEETAYNQVQHLGYHPEDIHHIIMTHMHFDHAGGLPDFPEAQVHLSQAELDHISGRFPGWAYNPRHWAHSPLWNPYSPSGEKWFDFDAIRLPDFEPEMWLISLPGHTPGHAGVAVRTEAGWLLHAGDAVPFNMAIEEAPDSISRRLLGPHGPHILTLMKAHPEVQLVGAHMSLDFYQQPG